MMSTASPLSLDEACIPFPSVYGNHRPSGYTRRDRAAFSQAPFIPASAHKSVAGSSHVMTLAGDLARAAPFWLPHHGGVRSTKLARRAPVFRHKPGADGGHAPGDPPVLPKTPSRTGLGLSDRVHHVPGSEPATRSRRPQYFRRVHPGQQEQRRLWLAVAASLSYCTHTPPPMPKSKIPHADDYPSTSGNSRAESKTILAEVGVAPGSLPQVSAGPSPHFGVSLLPAITCYRPTTASVLVINPRSIISSTASFPLIYPNRVLV